jgi:tetratricopeptide (TPR) repeat protein
LERHLAGDGPPLLLIAGEPGIGKTRLLAEVGQRARRQGWTVIEGGCHRRSGQEPFAPLLGALESHLRHSSLAALRAQLDGCAWLVRLLPELAETTLVPVPTWTLPPEQERRLMFAAVARLLGNTASPSGTLLVLDDLQWAGADALDLLASLVHAPRDQRLRVVGAYRSTEVRPLDALRTLLADLATAGLAGETRLGPMSPAQATALLGSVLDGARDVTSQVHAQVLARAGGVPYFLVSCAQALRYGALEGPGVDVPWSVAESIRQRVGMMPSEARDVLAMAAIVGRSVARRLLFKVAGALGQEHQTVIETLETVGQARLLVESGSERYRFPHDLIREVVWTDLSTARRASLHQRVAEALEQEPGEPPMELLAYHYSHAENVDKAIYYLEQAAEHAQNRYACTEAEGYYRRLIEQLDVLGRREQADHARECLGAALLTAARYEQAIETLEQVVAGYQARADLEGVARATAHIGEAHALRGSCVDGIARVKRLVLEAEVGPFALSAESLAKLYDALAQLLQRSARYAEQLAAAECACACAEEAQDARLLAHNQVSCGLALAYLNRREEAIPRLEGALPLLRASGDLWRLFHVLNALCWVHGAWGDFPRLQDYLAQAQVIAMQIDNPHLLPEVLFFQAFHAFVTGDWDRSLAQLQEAHAALGQASSPWVAAQVLAALGHLHTFRGHTLGAQYFDEAQHLIEHPFIERWIVSVQSECDLMHGDAAAAYARLEPLLEAQDIVTYDLLILMGWATLERDLGKAAEFVEHGIELARNARSPNHFAIVDGLRVWAQLAMRQGEWQAAEQAVDESLQVSQAMGYPYGKAKALYVAGLLHHAKGETERARQRLEEALVILSRLGEQVYAERIEQTLGEVSQGSALP